MRTIRVTGKGEIYVHPDTTELTITLEGMFQGYAETLLKSAERTEALKERLVPLGFSRTDLKTLRFSIDTEYEEYREHGAYKQRFLGYKFTHKMKLPFDSDNSRLGIILDALAGSGLNPEIRIAYTVKDQEAVKNELLGKAVRDATAKAEVLSSAAGLKLGDIQNVDYSWGQINFEVRPMNDLLMSEKYMMPAGGNGYGLDIEPDDIDVQDNVTVIWEIM